MDRVETLRTLLSMRSPHPALAHDFKGRVKDLDSVGMADMQPLRTKNNSFSQAIVEHESGLRVRMWWSYSTCIAREDVRTGLTVRSTYRYSNTTTSHQHSIRLDKSDSDDNVFRLPMCISDGVSPREAVQRLVDDVQAEKLKLVRSKQRWRWYAGSIPERIYALRKLCEAVGEPVELPPFREGITDRAYAKVAGAALRDAATANLLTVYNKFAKE